MDIIKKSLRPLKLEFKQDYWSVQFDAMASPCQILIDTEDKKHAQHLGIIAQHEAIRVEKEFSRYRKDNLIYKINHSDGHAIEVNQELAGLLEYAASCYKMSDGQFDITSGVLRKVWHFDCSDNVPAQSQITPLLKNIGWSKVTWKAPYFTLPKGMEIDLGGIGKEYAVDRSSQLLQSKTDCSFLINYGGDLFTNKPRKNNQGWLVGVEDPVHRVQASEQSSNDQKYNKLYELSRGGMATSGDSKRYLLKDGIHYSHILNPKTGWPVTQAPHSITVVSSTCTEAGILSTLAMLLENHAKEFLQSQDVIHWCN